MRRLTQACVLLVCALLAACDSTTAEEHTLNARERLTAGEFRAAVIELKNALQKDPEYAEARLLLGEAHLALGDYPSALKELERALDLGLDNDRVRGGILSAKVRLGRYQEVIGALADRGALTPELAVILADAYLAAGDPDRAEPLYRQGAELSRGNLGLARIAWQSGDTASAARHLEKAVELDPDNWEAWLQKGEYELRGSHLDAADAAFAEAAKLPASRVLARVGLTRVDLARGDLKAAADEVAEVLRLAPDFTAGHYLDGLIRFQQQDIDGAEAAIREVQRVVPDHPPSLYLMGAIKYRQGQLAQAENSIRQFLSVDPGNASAAKLLASIRFDQDDFAGTVEALQPFVDGSEDPQLLAMHGAAELRLGNPAAATRSLERAVELAPDTAPFRNQLALGLLASGDQSGAEAELESAIEVDGAQLQSDYLLAMLRMRAGDWDAAAESVEALIQKDPDNPIGYNLRGALRLAQQDQDGARAAFREALAKDPSFLPALQNLAKQEELNGNRRQAAALYEEFLEGHEGHEGALLALAELALRDGDPALAMEHLQRALDANPGALRPSLGLTRLYLASGRLEEAGTVVSAALARSPGLADLLLLQAEVYLQSGNGAAAEQAAGELQSKVAGGTKNTRLLLALGRLQARLGNLALARTNLEQVLEATGEAEPAVLSVLARLDLREGDLERARSRLETLEAVAAGQPDTRLLAADLALAEGEREAAEKIYSGLADDGVREGVMRLATLSLAGGRTGDALARLDGWLEKYPTDVGAQLLAADALMRTDQDRAMARYETLADTGNPVVLNNLAWLYMQKHDPRALETARRAVEAAPNNADVLDTLGWVIVQQDGDRDEAVKILRRSVQLKPGNPSVHYHLGIALRDAGDAAAAKQALARALESEDFPEAGDARAALAAL